MRFSENRTIAFIVLAACVVGSVFGLGGMGLARERSAVMAVYERGADTSLSTRHSVDAYLDDAAENARLMASEAELRLGASQAADNVAELADRVAKATDTNARYEAFTALKTAVEKLYGVMFDGVQESDFTNFKVAYDDFIQDVNMIKYDDYSKLAAGYNDLIGGFPGGVVASLTGQGALNTFEG